MTSENSRDLPPEALENLQMLQALRKAFGLSQEKLALKIGVSRRFIYSCGEIYAISRKLQEASGVFRLGQT